MVQFNQVLFVQKHFGVLFLVFVREEPGVAGRAGEAVFFSYTEKTSLLFWPSLSLVSVPKVVFFFFLPLSFAVSSYDDLVGFSWSQLLLRN